MPVIPGRDKMTPWDKHVARWGRGCGCELCPRAQKVCLARGVVPCQVLFIGEAPGASEDSLGKPFKGPAGKELDKIIDRGLKGKYTYALTNLVGCIPREANGEKSGQPLDDDIRQCGPRLQDFVVNVARPKMIVCVGSLARDWLRESVVSVGARKVKRNNVIDVGDVPRIHILHPSYILRQNWTQRESLIRDEAVKIKCACEELLDLPS